MQYYIANNEGYKKILYKTYGARNYIFHFLFYTKLYCGGAIYQLSTSNIKK